MIVISLSIVIPFVKEVFSSSDFIISPVKDITSSSPALVIDSCRFVKLLDVEMSACRLISSSDDISVATSSIESIAPISDVTSISPVSSADTAGIANINNIKTIINVCLVLIKLINSLFCTSKKKKNMTRTY